MSRIIKRCPRCKKQVHVLVVYSRSVPKSPVMIPIAGQYQCTECGLVFHNLFAKTLDQKNDVEFGEELLPDEVDIMEKMSVNEGRVE